MSSVVQITVGGVDVTNSVLWQTARFESAQRAAPGTFEMTLKDPDRTLGPFVTGDETILTIDGTRHFGGYLKSVSRSFAFPADTLPTDSRLWVLRGADYNILFDKRVTRNPLSYLTALPVFHGTDFDGDLIQYLCTNFLDLPAGLDFTTFVDNIVQPFAPDQRGDALAVGAWKQQGSTWREQMDLITGFSGGVYYIDPDLKLHYHAIEDTAAPFGFSDAPNGSSTIGMRDFTATEDIPQANDALVWGGSEWTEGAIFGRAENAASIAAHNRWQVAETHFGQDGYKLDTQWRADLLVEGSPAVTGFDPGLAYPQWSIDLAWFGEDVPGAHLHAGQLVTGSFTSLDTPLNPIVLPMRSVRISFVGLDPNGDGHVRFDGSMGLSLSDPFSLWSYLRSIGQGRAVPVAAATNATVDGTAYGSLGQFEPVLESGLTYKLPNDIGYVANTTQVYVDGILQTRGTAYTESDPVAGRITFASSPAGWIWVVCRTT